MTQCKCGVELFDKDIVDVLKKETIIGYKDVPFCGNLEYKRIIKEDTIIWTKYRCPNCFKVKKVKE